MARTLMTNADAAWLHMDRPTNLMIITSVMWFEEPVDWDRLTRVFTERLLERFPRFRQRVSPPPLHLGDLGLGRMQWDDDPDFDLDRHVVRHTLEAPGDDAALQRYVSDVMSQPLHRDRPLWTMHLVDGYRGGSAVVSRIHHCVADGISLIRVLLSLADGAPEDAGVTAPASERPFLTSLPEKAADLIHEGFDVVTDPARLRDVAELGRDSAKALGKLLFIGPDHRTVLKGRMGVHKHARWTSGWPLTTIKAIGRSHDATINDVLVACAAGALHRYLVHRDSLVDELRAIVPFNLRPLDRPVPASLGNEFGLVFLDLPVGISDPHERIVAVKAGMDQIKNSPEGPVSYGVLSAIGMTPVQIEKVIVDAFALKASCVLTNVPGPREPVSFAGSRVAGILPWVPQSGQIALGISIVSYDGMVTIGIGVDARLVPDPDVLLAGFEAELRALAPEGMAVELG